MPPVDRVCALCGVTFPGRRNSKYCPDCRTDALRAYSRQYYQNHKEEHRDWARQYRQERKDEYNARARQRHQEHRDDHNASTRQYYQDHKDECNARTRQYRQDHREEYRDWARQYYQERKDEYSAYSRQYYQDHREELSSYNRSYYAANKERIAAQRKAARAAKKSAALNSGGPAPQEESPTGGNTPMTQEHILAEYNKRESIRATADALGISHGVVRKVLIGHQIIDTPLIRRIAELRAAGMPQQDIAELLHISTSWVNANTPYDRGMMIDPSQTVNAQRIRDWRSRKKQHEEDPSND